MVLLAIDHMHQEGHSKCSECFFLSIFKKFPGIYKYLNDSCAETGNSGLVAIRKVARYMRQELLMDIIRLKLEIQNRTRIILLRKYLQEAILEPLLDPVGIAATL
jgi:hypothetical protein